MVLPACITGHMIRRTFPILASFLLFVSTHGAEAGNEESVALAVAVELEQLSLAPETAPLGIDAATLMQFYEERANATMWSGEDLAFSRATLLVARLENAGGEGLEAGD